MSARLPVPDFGAAKVVGQEYVEANFRSPPIIPATGPIPASMSHLHYYDPLCAIIAAVDRFQTQALRLNDVEIMDAVARQIGGEA